MLTGDGDGSGGMGGTGGVQDPGPGTAPYGKCKVTADCQAGLQCLDTAGGLGMVFGLSTTHCTIPCNSTNECPAPTDGTSPQLCTRGSCELDCSLGKTCPAGQACVSISVGGGPPRDLCGGVI